MPEDEGNFVGRIAKINKTFLASFPQCWYCSSLFSSEDEDCIEMAVPNNTLRFHIGECWDYFVVGVAWLNNQQYRESDTNMAVN